MENLALAEFGIDDLDELIELLESDKDSSEISERAKGNPDLKEQLKDLAKAKDAAGSVSKADTSFGGKKQAAGAGNETTDEDLNALLDETLSEVKEEGPAEEEAQDKTQSEEELKPAEKEKPEAEEEYKEDSGNDTENEYVPGIHLRRWAVETIEGFNRQADISGKKADKDGLMDTVQSNVRDYLAVTDKESLLDGDKASLKESAVDNALGRLDKLENACTEYVQKKHPILKPGRRRKKAVNLLRAQADTLKESRKGFEEVYEEKYLPEPALRKPEAKDEGGMGDDDGKKKKIDTDLDEPVSAQKRFVKGAEAMGAGAVMPFEITAEGDMMRADATGYKSYTELTAERRFDQVKMSNNALMQLTMVKTIGFLFGITDWQQIVDPETLLYNEQGDEVKSVRINIVPGMFGDVPEEINEADGKRFAESLKGDPEGLKLLDAFLGGKLDSIKELTAATGLGAAVLYKRIMAIRHYLKQLRRS